MVDHPEALRALTLRILSATLLCRPLRTFALPRFAQALGRFCPFSSGLVSKALPFSSLLRRGAYIGSSRIGAGPRIDGCRR